MDQSRNDPPASNPGPPAGIAYVPAPPQTVNVVAKPGGFVRSLTFIAGLLLFGCIFIIGLLLGIVLMFGSNQSDGIVVRKVHRDGGRQALAIIPVRGAIDDERATFVRGCVNHVLDDDSIKGVVLRVDSPGGGVSASDQIWHQVERLKEAGLPVIASFGGMAASGGYYVSCGTDYIIAEETCITGSIGVISQVFTMDQLMDKVGITPITIVASGSPDKDIANDMFRPWTEKDRETIQVMLDAAYDIFKQRVSDGRKGIDSEHLDLAVAADGSIFTAAGAIKLGLVDDIGYLSDAIAYTEKKTGIRRDDATVYWLNEQPTLFGGFLSSSASPLSQTATLQADEIRSLINDLTSPKVMYLMNAP